MESAQDICGMTKGPHRHNEEVAEAVSEKEDKVRKVEENTKEARMEYKKSIKNAKSKKQKECANDLNDSECQNEIFRMAKQVVKDML